MSIFQRLLDVICPCASLRSDDAGTWSSAGVPVLSCPVTPGELSLPQGSDCLAKQTRFCSTRINRCLYQYDKVPDLDAPWASKVSGVLSLSSQWATGQLVAEFRARHNHCAAAAAVGDAGHSNSWAEFRKLFQDFPVPQIADDWVSDRIYADQLLAGFDPITIARLTMDGAGRGVNWSELRTKLNPEVLDALKNSLADSPEQGIEEGRVFVTDYQAVALSGPTDGALGARGGKVPLAPIALFVRLHNQSGLQPVVIQLGQTPNAPIQIADGSANWLAARSWAQQASYALTQVIYHLTQHHVIAEAFALATPRRLPQRHPLYALLVHHISGTLAVNIGTVIQFFDVATQSFMFLGRNAGYRLINAHYDRWTFDALDFAKNLAQRAVEDTELLPYFPQRDDGLLYWSLIDDFVRDYLAVFYGIPGTPQADAAVAADYELQDWTAELSKEAGGQGNLAGFPARIMTFEQLHRVLHLLIFTVGPHHASLNFAQLKYGSFIPNMPALVSLLPPQGQFDDRDLLNAMPALKPAALQNEMTFKAAYWMGSFLDYADFFCGGGRNAQARNVIERYHAQLDQIEATIKARNKERERAGNLTYDLLMPGNVPNSVSA